MIFETCSFKKTLPINLPNVKEVIIIFCDAKKSDLSVSYNLEPNFYQSFTDVVEARNTPVEAKHDLTDTCVTVEMNRKIWEIAFRKFDLVWHSLVRIWDLFRK